MAQVTVDNLPGFVQDANLPAPEYIISLDGRRSPLTSIDACYAMADITCQSLALTKVWRDLTLHPAYATAPTEVTNGIRANILQLSLIQARNLTTLAMLFRAYSLRTGFQTDYMTARKLTLSRITAPDENGEATSYACAEPADWIRVAKNVTDDALRRSERKPDIVLRADGATMGAAAAVLAPVVLASAEAGAGTAATVGAVTAAEAAGSAVVAAGGTAVGGLLATLAFPIIGIVAVITLGAVTTYGVKKGFAWWENRDAAAQKQSDADAKAFLQALEDLKNCNTEACRQAARERIEILNQRRNDNAAQAGGLLNAMFGGTFDFQSIAYAALGLTAVYLGAKLIFQNRAPASGS